MKKASAVDKNGCGYKILRLAAKQRQAFFYLIIANYFTTIFAKLFLPLLRTKSAAVISSFV